MRQDGTVVAVRRITLPNGQDLGGGRLNGIAVSPEANINLVGKFIGILIFSLKLCLFGLKGVDGRLLFRRNVGGCALEFSQTLVMAIRKVDGDLDPFLALGRDCLGFSFQLPGHETVEQSHKGVQCHALHVLGERVLSRDEDNVIF
jgi:hypothetical protein